MKKTDHKKSVGFNNEHRMPTEIEPTRVSTTQVGSASFDVSATHSTWSLAALPIDIVRTHLKGVVKVWEPLPSITTGYSSHLNVIIVRPSKTERLNRINYAENNTYQFLSASARTISPWPPCPEVATGTNVVVTAKTEEESGQTEYVIWYCADGGARHLEIDGYEHEYERVEQCEVLVGVIMHGSANGRDEETKKILIATDIAVRVNDTAKEIECNTVPSSIVGPVAAIYARRLPQQTRRMRRNRSRERFH